MGYGLSPASRAGRICGKSTRDTIWRKRIKSRAVATNSEDLTKILAFDA